MEIACTINPVMKRKEARRRSLRLASSVCAVLALFFPALPYIHIIFDESSVSVSGYLAIFSSIRVSEAELVGFPLGMRVILILSLIAVAAGLAATVLKKSLLSSGMFVAAFVFGISLTAFLSTLRTDLLKAGCFTAAGSMQFGWILFLIFVAASAIPVSGCQS